MGFTADQALPSEDPMLEEQKKALLPFLTVSANSHCPVRNAPGLACLPTLYAPRCMRAEGTRSSERGPEGRVLLQDVRYQSGMPSCKSCCEALHGVGAHSKKIVLNMPGT